MKKYSGLVLCLMLGLLSGATAAYAQSRDSLRLDPHEGINPNVEDYVWKEGESEIPPFPEEDNLVEYEVDQPSNRFSYFIDSESLVLGKDDIVRYTLVARSRTGGKNVMFEGVRCSTKEFKTYAYGTGRGKFKKARKPVWRPVHSGPTTLYRQTLVDSYLCNPYIVNATAEKIVNQMRFHYRDIDREGFR